MPIENADYPSQLDPDNFGPTGPDSAGEGDNHILQNKYIIKNTFSKISGPVTANQNDLNITAGAAAVGVTKDQFQMLAGLSTSASLETRLSSIEAVELAWGGITGTLADQTDLVTALASKADLDEPHFGPGYPTSQTPAQGDNSNIIATTRYVDKALADSIYTEHDQDNADFPVGSYVLVHQFVGVARNEECWVFTDPDKTYAFLARIPGSSVTNGVRLLGTWVLRGGYNFSDSNALVQRIA